MTDIKQRILLPKGEALEACTLACEQELDTELPRYTGGALSQDTQGLEIFWLKPKDIPRLVSKGLGDVGLVGTDILLETDVPIDWGPTDQLSLLDNRLRARRAGFDPQPMCRFSLLGLSGQGEETLRAMIEPNGGYEGSVVSIPTSYPRMLFSIANFKGLPILPDETLTPSGSVEAYARLMGSPGVADLVETGGTAARNGLVEITQLTGIYPEMITRTQA